MLNEYKKQQQHNINERMSDVHALYDRQIIIRVIYRPLTMTFGIIMYNQLRGINIMKKFSENVIGNAVKSFTFDNQYM